MGDWKNLALAVSVVTLCACGKAGSGGGGASGPKGGTGGQAGSGGTAGDSMPGGGAPPQDSACGIANTAFCATFEEGPSAARGRAGDLDPALFSAGRIAPQSMAGGEMVVWV